MAQQAKLKARLADLANGRDEMNLCELPFATLSERAGTRNILEFQIEDYDRELGQTVRRALTVAGDPKHGLPTAKDEEVYLGLLKYTYDYNGFSSPDVHFSRSDLFDLMAWKKSDWAYARLTTAMHRLVGVRLSYQNLWRDNHNKQWRDQGAFGLLDSFKFRDSRESGRNDSFEEFSSQFQWSSVLFNSFDSGYLKRIDCGLSRSLSVTGRRLYRYLDKHFHPPAKMRLTLDMNRLAYQHIGISPSTEPDKVRKRYLIPAIEELEQVGYLAPLSLEKRFSLIKRGKWSVTFERMPEQQLPEVSEDHKHIFEALIRRGISEDAARKFASHHARDVVV